MQAGDVLYTASMVPIMTFLEDTGPGVHDTTAAACRYGSYSPTLWHWCKSKYWISQKNKRCSACLLPIWHCKLSISRQIAILCPRPKHEYQNGPEGIATTIWPCTVCNFNLERVACATLASGIDSYIRCSHGLYVLQIGEVSCLAVFDRTPWKSATLNDMHSRRQHSCSLHHVHFIVIFSGQPYWCTAEIPAGTTRGELSRFPKLNGPRLDSSIVLQEKARSHDSCTNNLFNALKDLGYSLADDPREGYYTPCPFNLWYVKESR